MSTYRLQFQPGFGFREAAAVVPYLAALGITDCYCSPYFRARPGSTHGYDICDYNALNPDLGDRNDYTRFIDALGAEAMGQIIDFVPNHMSIHPSANTWWRDVLANGRRSSFARCFAIDWTPVKRELQGKVLLPILSAQYGEVLERGELIAEVIGNDAGIRYRDLMLPLSPSTADEVRALGVAAFNGVPGDPASYDRLHDLLERQHYRLAYWRTSSDEINYRRFFDVDDLVAVRMEDHAVFTAAHRLLGELITDARVSGIRVDHVDGLASPKQYFERLQQLAPSGQRLFVVVEKILAKGELLDRAWPVAGSTGYEFLNRLNGVFVQDTQQATLRRVYRRFTGRANPLAEIVYHSKRLIMETTLSSELLALAVSLNRISERDRRSRDFTQNSLRRALREYIACLSVYRTYVSGNGCTPEDESRIRAAIGRAARANPHLEASIFEFATDVLLTRGATEDERTQRLAFVTRLQQYTGAVQARAMEDTAIYRYNVLLSSNEVGGDPAHPCTTPSEFHAANQACRDTHPHSLLATSTHDTKLSEDVRARLNALSELPDEWGKVIRRWARINASNRVRINDEWAPDRNDEYRFYQVLLGVWPPPSNGTAPDLEAARGLVPRLQAYMLKAIKEAKIHTSWINDNAAYDAATTRFVERTLAGPGAAAFLWAFEPFARRIARAGMVNSLSQVILKVASPGIPDFYQGAENWDLHLVDPDNRHLIDFASHIGTLREVEPIVQMASSSCASCRAAASAQVAELVSAWPDGRIKVLTTAAGLRLRRRMASVFVEGDYLPLEIRDAPSGAAMIGFARQHPDGVVVAMAPRLMTRSIDDRDALPMGTGAWGAAYVPAPMAWAGLPFRNVLTGETVSPQPFGEGIGLPVHELLAICPVGLLAAAGRS